MKNKILLCVFLASCCFSHLSAETKVSIYSVPFGLVGDVTKDNFRAFDGRLASIPTKTFSLQENDMVVSGEGITVVFEDKNAKADNFNKLLAALYAYAKETPGVDISAVKQAVGVMAIKKELE